MFKLLLALNAIRLRKFLAKDDYLAYVLFFSFYGVAIYFLNGFYAEYSKYILLLSVEILVYHSNRKDIELLKLRSDYLLILFVEYLIYSTPVLLIILINKDYISFLIYMALLFLYTIVPKFNFKIVPFPFRFFDPFWTISFRKNKLYLYVPLLVFIAYMAQKSGNINLNYFNLLLVSLLACIPSFERENPEHLKISVYVGKSYLLNHIKTAIFNTLFLIIPLIILFCIFQHWNLLVYLPLVFVAAGIGVLFKYAFFDNVFLQVIFFMLFFGNILYGFPLLLIPFLYHYGLKKIKKMQYAAA